MVKTRKPAKNGGAKNTVKSDLVKSPKTGKMIQKANYERLYGKTSSKKSPMKPAKKTQHRLSADEPLPPALIKAIAEQKAQLTPEELKYTLQRTTQPHLRRKLEDQIKKEKDPRGQKTRGWSARAPQKGEPRKILQAACGDEAFLLPKDLKFPIMAKCGNGLEKGKCKCKIDCGGVRAALIRARQFGYTNIAKAAEKLLETKCGGKPSEPSTPELVTR